MKRETPTRNLMLEEMTRPPIDPDAQKATLNLIFQEELK